MKYTELGKTGLHVSEIGFGAWAIGGQAWGNDITDKNAMAALQEAWQQGINLFDTADCYGDGHSEALIGEFLLGQREKSRHRYQRRYELPCEGTQQGLYARLPDSLVG